VLSQPFQSGSTPSSNHPGLGNNTGPYKGIQSTTSLDIPRSQTPGVGMLSCQAVFTLLSTYLVTGLLQEGKERLDSISEKIPDRPEFSRVRSPVPSIHHWPPYAESRTPIAPQYYAATSTMHPAPPDSTSGSRPPSNDILSLHHYYSRFIQKNQTSTVEDPACNSPVPPSPGKLPNPPPKIFSDKPFNCKTWRAMYEG
jgi:hypothetical protein